MVCTWCQLRSDEKPFHIGAVEDEFGKQFFTAICPRCTNCFAPFIQNTLHKDRNKVVGLIWEKKITKYAREHFDTFLWKLKGRLPNFDNVMDIEATKREIPEKYWPADWKAPKAEDKT